MLFYTKKSLVSVAFIVSAICFSAFAVSARDAAPPVEGYEIKVQLSDFKNDTLLLGYYLADKQYIKDTSIRDKSTGFFTFKGAKTLPSGMYMLVLPPENQFLQLLISDKEQHFTLIAHDADITKGYKLQNAPENEQFFKYIDFIANQSKAANLLKAERTKDTTKAPAIKTKLENLDASVKKYQEEVIRNNPGTTLAMLLKATVEIEGPNFNIKNEDSLKLANYYYYKEHWFDNHDLKNPAMLRTPVLYGRLDYYITKLTPQHPDSVGESIVRVLEMMKPAKETFQYYFVHYLNEYSKNTIVGFDAVYVKLAKKYIPTGITDSFIDKEQREKIMKDATALEPVLIGKKGANLRMFRQDSSIVNLYDVKSKYTILYFWAPDCSHCKKSIPHLVDFYKKWKTKNVEIFCVCNQPIGTVKTCWEAVKERNMGEWINVADPYELSHYRSAYRVLTTPKIYVLDQDKTIISKDISSEQLDDLMTRIVEEDAKSAGGGKSK